MNPLPHLWSAARTLIVAHRTRSIAQWCAALVALYALLGFIVLPWLAKPKIEQLLSETLARTVTIGALHVNPFALSVRVDDLRVQGAHDAQPLLHVGEFAANAALASLWRRAPVLQSLRVTNPQLHLARAADGQYNVQDLLDRYFWTPTPPDAPPARYSLNNIEVLGGQIEFDDRLEKQKHEIRDLRIGIPFLSSLPYAADIYVRPEISALLNGAPLALSGETKPFGKRRESTLHITFNKLALTPYFRYSPIPLRFELASGTLDAQLTLYMVSDAGATTTLSLTGAAALHDLVLRQRDGEPLLGVGALEVKLHALDLQNRRVGLAEVRVSEPQVHVTRFGGGNLNLALLLPLETGTPKASAAPPEEPWRFSIDRFTLDQGRVQVTDYAAPGTFKITLTGIALQAEHIGNQPGQTGALHAALQIEGRDRLSAQGEVGFDPRSANGRFELGDLRLDRFLPYFAPGPRVAAGTLSGSGALHVAAQKAGGVRLSKLDAQLRDSRIIDASGRTRLRAGLVSVKDAGIDLQRRHVAVGQVSARDLVTTVRRDADGHWRLPVLADSAPAVEATPQADRWTYRIGTAALTHSRLTLNDRSVEPPILTRVSDARGQISDIASANDADATPAQLKLDATIDGHGSVAVTGTFALSPFSAHLQIEARDLPIAPWQAYWADLLDLRVTRGGASLRGVLDIETAHTTMVRYRGTAAVTDFSAGDGQRELLRWKRLQLHGTTLHTAPLALNIGAITLGDFRARVIVRPDGQLNLQQLLRSKAPADAQTADATPAVAPSETAEAASAQTTTTTSATASATEAGSPVQIGRIRFENGQLDFSDRFIKPNYSAHIQNLGGTVAALKPGQPGQFTLQGKIDGTAPVTIEGRVDPLGAQLFLEARAQAREINLPPLSPYAVRYVGYPIERGKLSMDVRYHIENEQLTAQNRITLNQLSFGAQPATDATTSLPVHLAVALLKDADGVIDLDIPIGGSLNDPQFSVGGVIAKAVVNLLWKTVTAPFSALGALFGGSGETLSHVGFAPGTATLDETAVATLDKLARALRKRPALNLDIAGRADAAIDGESLKERTLARRMKAQKQKDLSGEGITRTLDEIEIAPAEQDKYLQRVYEDEKFDKPRNFLGFTKSVPAAEMRQRLLEHFAVNENALRRLANDRATAALDWLKNTGGVPSERLYVVAPRLDATGIDDGGTPNRVDFALH